MSGAHFGNRCDRNKMELHRVRLRPKSGMAGVIRTGEFGCLLTEQTVCTQGTDRVEATSQGHLGLPAAGQGGTWNPER